MCMDTLMETRRQEDVRCRGGGGLSRKIGREGAGGVRRGSRAAWR